MAIKVNQDNCIGCSACLGACPFGAIVMQDGDKAFITEACTVCGACLESCPVSTIIREDEEKVVAMDKADYAGVWVYIEQLDGHIRGVSLNFWAKAANWPTQ